MHVALLGCNLYLQVGCITWMCFCVSVVFGHSDVLLGCVIVSMYYLVTSLCIIVVGITVCSHDRVTRGTSSL